MRKTCPNCDSILVPDYIEGWYVCEQCLEEEFMGAVTGMESSGRVQHGTAPSNFNHEKDE